MDTLSDNALMMKVKEGDIDKMGLLYERYHRPLYGFIFHMTRQKESSEDLVQNVFFRMLKYRKNFIGGEFKTWMYHLARNVLNDHFKNVKKMPDYGDLERFEGKAEDGIRADNYMEKQQDLKVLALAMEHLTSADKELLILCRFQELKYQEVARILNITESAVKVRVHRAMAALKSYYSKIKQ